MFLFQRQFLRKMETLPPEEPAPDPPQEQPLPDGDGDGVPDGQDLCPDQGLPDVDANGCWIEEIETPLVNDTDNDGDGIRYIDDACPDQAGPPENGGCPVPATEPPAPPADSDGDGIPDNSDGCPNQGNLGNGVDGSGCPIPAPGQTEAPPQDTDGDGVNDLADYCPNEGTLGNVDIYGCPPDAATEPATQPATQPPVATEEADTDNDGVVNSLDRCPTLPLTAAGAGGSSDGCPADPDNDGFYAGVTGDLLDNCPAEAGTVQGCPANENTDTDNDGVADSLDRCPTLPLNAAGPGGSSDGCPADPDNDGFYAGVTGSRLDNCPTVAGTVQGCPATDNTTPAATEPAASSANVVEVEQPFYAGPNCDYSWYSLPADAVLSNFFESGTGVRTETYADGSVRVIENGVTTDYPPVADVPNTASLLNYQLVDGLYTENFDDGSIRVTNTALSDTDLGFEVVYPPGVPVGSCPQPPAGAGDAAAPTGGPVTGVVADVNAEAANYPEDKTTVETGVVSSVVVSGGGAVRYETTINNDASGRELVDGVLQHVYPAEFIELRRITIPSGTFDEATGGVTGIVIPANSSVTFVFEAVLTMDIPDGVEISFFATFSSPSLTASNSQDVALRRGSYGPPTLERHLALQNGGVIRGAVVKLTSNGLNLQATCLINPNGVNGIILSGTNSSASNVIYKGSDISLNFADGNATLINENPRNAGDRPTPQNGTITDRIAFNNQTDIPSSARILVQIIKDGVPTEIELEASCEDPNQPAAVAPPPAPDQPDIGVAHSCDPAQPFLTLTNNSATPVRIWYQLAQNNPNQLSLPRWQSRELAPNESFTPDGFDAAMAPADRFDTEILVNLNGGRRGDRLVQVTKTCQTTPPTPKITFSAACELNPQTNDHQIKLSIASADASNIAEISISSVNGYTGSLQNVTGPQTLTIDKRFSLEGLTLVGKVNAGDQNSLVTLADGDTPVLPECPATAAPAPAIQIPNFNADLVCNGTQSTLTVSYTGNENLAPFDVKVAGRTVARSGGLIANAAPFSFDGIANAQSVELVLTADFKGFQAGTVFFAGTTENCDPAPAPVAALGNPDIAFRAYCVGEESVVEITNNGQTEIQASFNSQVGTSAVTLAANTTQIAAKLPAGHPMAGTQFEVVADGATIIADAFKDCSNNAIGDVVTGVLACNGEFHQATFTNNGPIPLDVFVEFSDADMAPPPIGSQSVTVPPNGTASVQARTTTAVYQSYDVAGESKTFADTPTCTTTLTLSVDSTCAADGSRFVNFTNGGTENLDIQSAVVTLQDDTTVPLVAPELAGVANPLAGLQPQQARNLRLPENAKSVTFTLPDGTTKVLNNICTPGTDYTVAGICDAGVPFIVIENKTANDASAVISTQAGDAAPQAQPQTTLPKNQKIGWQVPTGVTSVSVSVSLNPGLPSVINIADLDCSQTVQISGTCTDGAATFTIQNPTAGAIDVISAVVEYANGETAEQTLQQFAANAQQQVTGLSSENGGAKLTIVTRDANGTQETVSKELNSCSPPRITGRLYCEDGAPVLSFTNTGGNMTNHSYNFTVDYDQGASSTDTVTGLEAGAKLVIPLPKDRGDVAFRYNLTAGEFVPAEFRSGSGRVNNCALAPTAPVLAVEGVCTEGVPVFTIFNNGLDMTAGAPYTIFYGDRSTSQGTTNTITNRQFQSINGETGKGTATIVVGQAPTVIRSSVPACTDDNPAAATVRPAAPSPSAATNTAAPRRPGRQVPAAPVPVVPSGNGIIGMSDVLACEGYLLYHSNPTGQAWDIHVLGNIINRPAELGIDVSQNGSSDDVSPSRSADGRYVAFSSNRDGNWEIYVTDITTGTTQRLTQNESAIDTDPVISADGTKVVFESDVDGNWNIFMVELATGAITPITLHPFDDLNPSFSPGGTKILFQTNREDRNVYQIFEFDLATSSGSKVSDGTASDINAAYSFDGQSIAFLSNRSLGYGLHVLNRQTGEITLLSPFRADVANYAWSPQGNMIAFESNASGTSDIYVYDFRTQEGRLLTANNTPEVEFTDEFAPAWACDDETTVYFTTNVNNVTNLVGLPAGRLHQIWSSIFSRNVVSHPALKRLVRILPLDGCFLRILSANCRKIAMF